MSNLRISADFTMWVTSVTATSEDSGYPATNLLSPFKSDTWKTSSNTATLTIVITGLGTYNMIYIPQCKLPFGATITSSKALLNTNKFINNNYYNFIPTAANPIHNTWSYNAGDAVILYFNETLLGTITIDITVPAGGIEMSSIFLGNYWSPEHNCDYGASMTSENTAQIVSNDATDWYKEGGVKYRSLNLNLQGMSPADRDNLLGIMRYSDKFFISVMPEEATDITGEGMMMMVGGLTNSQKMAIASYNNWVSELNIREA